MSEVKLNEAVVSDPETLANLYMAALAALKEAGYEDEIRRAERERIADWLMWEAQSEPGINTVRVIRNIATQIRAIDAGEEE